MFPLRICPNNCFVFLSKKINGSVRQPPANTEIVEEKKASTVSEIQKQNERKKNMKRMVEVSTYEQKRYMAHTRILRIFTICFILVFILIIARHLLGRFSGMPVNILLVAIMAIGAILIINEVVINTTRDNQVYDKFKYPLDADHAMKHASGRTLWGRLKGALGSGGDLLRKPDVPNCVGSTFVGTGEVADGAGGAGGATGGGTGGVNTFMSGEESGSAIVDSPAWKEAPAAQPCTTNGNAGYKFSDAYVEEVGWAQGCKPCTGLSSLACNSSSRNWSNICKDFCDGLPEPSASIVSENLGEELARYLMVPGGSTPIVRSPSPVCGAGVVFGSGDSKDEKITLLIKKILSIITTENDVSKINTMSYNEFGKVLQELLYMRDGGASSDFTVDAETVIDAETVKCGGSGEKYPRKLKQKYVRGILSAMKKKFPTATVDTNWADDFVALPSDVYYTVDGDLTENVTCDIYCRDKGKECLDAQHTNNTGVSAIVGDPDASCERGRPDAIGGNLRCQCAKDGWNPAGIEIAEVVEYLTSVEGSQNTPQ